MGIVTKFTSVIVIWALVLASANSTLGQTFTSGFWSGQVTQSNDGVYNGCGMYADYSNGITLHFLISRDFDFFLGFHSDQWNLQGVEDLTVQYWIDGYEMRSRPGRVLSSQMATMDVEDRTRIFEEFRQGYILYIDAFGDRVQFDLTGTGEALNQLLNCVRHYNVNGQANAISRASISERLAAITFVANVLSQTGAQSFKILSDSERQKLFPQQDVAWVSEEVLGFLRVVQKSDANTVRDVANLLIIGDSHACMSDFVSGVRKSHSGYLERVYTACSEDAGTFVNYSILPVQQSKYYVIAHVALSSSQDYDDAFDVKLKNQSALEMDERIQKALPISIRP